MENFRAEFEFSAERSDTSTGLRRKEQCRQSPKQSTSALARSKLFSPCVKYRGPVARTLPDSSIFAEHFRPPLPAIHQRTKHSKPSHRQPVAIIANVPSPFRHVEILSA